MKVAYKFMNESALVDSLYKSKEVGKVYSPILIEDNKTLFYVDGVCYRLKDNMVESLRNSDVPLDFLKLTNVLERFNFNKQTMTWFGKAKVVIDINENTLTINDKVVEGNIDEYLYNTGIYKYGDKDVSFIKTAFENYNNFVTLDFLTTYTEGNTKINLMRFENNVYLNEVCLVTGSNKFGKVEDFSKMINEMKGLIKQDLSELVIDLLEGEERAKAELHRIEDELIDKLAFLKEQRSKLAEENKSISFIKEADKLLVDEIAKIEEKINKNRSDGFIPGVLNDVFKTHEVGTKFKLKAIDYTSRGDEDLIECYLVDGSIILIPKILIKIDADETI